MQKNLDAAILTVSLISNCNKFKAKIILKDFIFRHTEGHTLRYIIQTTLVLNLFNKN